MEKKKLQAANISRFLLKYPPFYYLPKVDLDHLIEQMEVIKLEVGEYLFEEEEDFKPFVYILRDGQIEIIKQFEDNTQVIDVAKKGDVLGTRAILSHKPYLASARSTKKSSIFRVPESKFLVYLEQFPRLALFFARGFAEGKPLIRDPEQEHHNKEMHFLSREPVLFMRTEDVLIPNPIELLLKGPGSTTLREVARKMKERHFGSFLIVDDQQKPLGIVTESDFVRRGSEQPLTWESPVNSIMSSPVFTISKGATAAELIVSMTSNKIDHLVVTEDGTPDSPVQGIISQRDILLMHGNNPAVLVRNLQNAADTETLLRIRNRADELIFNYLRQEVAIPFIAEIITEINDTLVNKAIAFSLARLEKEGKTKPNLAFAFLALGSEGRREQLRRTDQDNAIIYEDPPEGEEEVAFQYFHQLGTYIVEVLLESGFARCPGDIMASNPEWVKPLSGWKNQFNRWIEQPNSEGLIGVSIFFDYRPVHGSAWLTEELTDYIFEVIGDRRGFLNFFAQSALHHPSPMGFFGKFILETTGDKKDVFDLKARAMRPLDHAARVLVYSTKIRGVTNTVKRYEKLGQVLPDQKLFREASLAYEILMRYRGINSFRNQDSGRYIYPKKLTKIERETLKTCFTTVERVQQYLKNVFRVSY